MSITQYRSALRSAARGLWGGVFDYAWFADAMMVAIDQGMMRAFTEGTEACGITKEEWTFEERMAQRRAMFEQYMYVGSLGEFIQQNSKATGGSWGSVENRVEVWVNKYNAVVNAARTMACKDQKLMWMLDQVRVSKEHCSSCLKLSGKVKRASQWDASGWQCQGSMLDCGGWRCACALVPTDAPMSKGPLPRP